MSAKSLGKLPVIYAVDELQNPLPRISMLKVIRIALEGEMMSFQIAKDFRYRDSTLCEGGRGLTIVISAAKIGRGWKIPNTVWVFQGLLADIVAQAYLTVK